MCRWVSYIGNPVPLATFIVEPAYSLIDQSMSARMGPNPTNGDGFGVGWFGRNNEPGVYKSEFPAWSDQNLNELSRHIESGLFLAHIRRSTGTPVQSTNCHPFGYAHWMFVHNGLIRDLQTIRRELLLAVDPKYFPFVRGNTDSELIFYLALTFGLNDEPIPALERAIGLVEKLGHDAGIEFPMQGTLGLADGNALYAVRYSSENDSRTLFHSEDIDVLRKLAPDTARADMFDSRARAIVSEPLSDLEGAWKPIDESVAMVVNDGDIEYFDFAPKAP